MALLSYYGTIDRVRWWFSSLRYKSFVMENVDAFLDNSAVFVKAVACDTQLFLI